MRVGIGYDIHRLVEGSNIILGGVNIVFNKSLSGNSDADVLIHAIMDALLGAGGFQDIGHYFPADEPKYRNISSLLLLRDVDTILKSSGYEVINIDSTLIAEEPKIAPYVNEMKQKISETLNINKTQIGIKATTNEGLGSIGEMRGIAAFAIATLK